MRRVSDGYTIVEVIIVLAVAAALLVPAMKLISGRQEQVDFNQKIRDTKAQIQSWINEVANGFTGADPNSYVCAPNSAPPYVVKTSSLPSSAVPQCVFIGKAVQFFDQPKAPAYADTIYVYSVFGIRADTNGQPPGDMATSTPAPAVGPNGGQPNGSVDLTNTYKLSPAYIKSIVSSTPVTDSHLIGFYDSFNNSSNVSSNGNENVRGYEFNFTNSNQQFPANASQSQGSQVVDCLEMNLTSASNTCKAGVLNGNPQGLQQYKVCLTDGHYTAEIIISTAGSGLNPIVSLDYINC